MSLKGFHLVFILLAILVTLGFAGWVFLLKGNANLGVAITGVFSAAVGLALIPYGAWFVVKSRKIIV